MATVPNAAEKAKALQWLNARGKNKPEHAAARQKLQNAATREAFADAILQMHGVDRAVIDKARLR